MDRPSYAKESTSTTNSDNKIQIAFLLDTSSSMDGLIDQAKARLWNILNEILKAKKDGAAPRIEVALYHYGNTTLLPEKGYIQQLSSLTTDVDAISEKLFSLRTSGGDEYCGHVILRATDELAWDEDDATVKIVYIAGNEPFDQGEVKPAHALRKATDRGITVNTILCGNPNGSDGPSWKAGARDGKGQFFYINQDEKVVYIPSPFDEAIGKCNQRLNATYIPFGSRGRLMKANQIRQDENAAGYSQANLSARAKYKASANYSNAQWDVVDAYRENAQTVLKAQSTLPDSLAGLPPEQLRRRIERIGAERSALNKKIAELTSQRDAFVAQARRRGGDEPGNTLGDKVSADVRSRLGAAGYGFE